MFSNIGNENFLFLYFVAWAVELLSKYKGVTQNLRLSTEASVPVFSRFFFARKAQLRKWKGGKTEQGISLKIYVKVIVPPLTLLHKQVKVKTRLSQKERHTTEKSLFTFSQIEKYVMSFNAQE